MGGDSLAAACGSTISAVSTTDVPTKLDATVVGELSTPVEQRVEYRFHIDQPASSRITGQDGRRPRMASTAAAVVLLRSVCHRS
jgi:hypothetical protein